MAFARRAACRPSGAGSWGGTGNLGFGGLTPGYLISRSALDPVSSETTTKSTAETRAA